MKTLEKQHEQDQQIETLTIDDLLYLQSIVEIDAHDSNPRAAKVKMDLLHKLNQMRKSSYTYADKDIIPSDEDNEESLVEF
jgi:hypothetical protein